MFSSCEDDINLLLNDVPNTFFDVKCGTYNIRDKKATERCGNAWDSYGYQYRDDVDVVEILLVPSDDSITDLNPTFTLTFDSNYLEPGRTLTQREVKAKCSRFKPENGDDPTYYTVSPASLELTVKENRGEKKHSILGDEAQWLFSWKVDCSGLQMTAEGQDQINLDYRTARHAKIHLGERPPKKQGD